MLDSLGRSTPTSIVGRQDHRRSAFRRRRCGHRRDHCDRLSGADLTCRLVNRVRTLPCTGLASRSTKNLPGTTRLRGSIGVRRRRLQIPASSDPTRQDASRTGPILRTLIEIPFSAPFTLLRAPVSDDRSSPAHHSIHATGRGGLADSTASREPASGSVDSGWALRAPDPARALSYFNAAMAAEELVPSSGEQRRPFSGPRPSRASASVLALRNPDRSPIDLDSLWDSAGQGCTLDHGPLRHRDYDRLRPGAPRPAAQELNVGHRNRDRDA